MLKDSLEGLATRSPVIFNAELFTISIYKGEPRKELNKAWEKLVNYICPANAYI